MNIQEKVVPQPDRGKLRADLEALSVMLRDLYPNSGYSAVASKAAAALSPAPLTINRNALKGAIRGVLFNVSNYPHKAQPYLLGTDNSPLTDKITDAVLSHLSAQTVEGEVESLAEHDKQVAAKALKDAAVSLWGDESAERGTTKAQYNAIYATWLEKRAASIEQTEAE